MNTFDFDLERITKNKRNAKILAFSLFGLAILSFVLTTILQDRNTSLVYFIINVVVSLTSAFIGFFLLSVKVRQYSQIIYLLTKNKSSSFQNDLKFLRVNEENVVNKFLTFKELEFIDNKNNIISLYILIDNDIKLEKNALYKIKRTDNVIFEIKDVKKWTNQLFQKNY